MTNTNTKITNIVAIDFVLDNYDIPSEYREKLEKIKTSFSRKSANRKPTATQIANEKLKEVIVEVLNSNGSPMTVSEIMASSSEFEGLTNQKITSLVTQLKNAGTIEKIVDGKKSTFKVA